MKIAVLSGKGGTGKTFVSTNLAYVIKDSTYVDCDVEEPNGTLFFKLDNSSSEDVTVKLPTVDDKLCDGCRKCVDFCKFNALAFINNKPLLFDEVCHSCGGCSLVCTNNAISEIDKKIGEIVSGKYQHVNVVAGKLNIGEASGVPIIKAELNKVKDNPNNVIIDCPPGSACTVSESISDSDVCILVVEPTSFGLHNLKMSYELVKVHHKPCGIVINKYEDEYDELNEFCIQEELPILAKIPYQKELGKSLANGNIASEKDETIYQLFEELVRKIGELR